jgi:hypothetical protein
VKQAGEWWIGWIEEIPGVNCQERTRDELVVSSCEALVEALAFDREEALAAVDGGYQEETLTI